MGRPRPAVGGLHWHRLDSVPSPGLGQREYLCAGVPKGGYSVRLLGAKTEIPAETEIPDIVAGHRERKRKSRLAVHEQFTNGGNMRIGKYWLLMVVLAFTATVSMAGVI